MKTYKKKETLCSLARGIIAVLVLWLGLHQVPAAAENCVKCYPRSFAGLIKKLNPSVVNIIAVKIMHPRTQDNSPSATEDPLRDFMERYFRDQMPQEYRQTELGTGFIIDSEGFIITTNHMVERTEEIKVRFSDEKEFSAQIIGRDPRTDLALIKINANSPLMPLKLGDSDSVEVGDWVVAIGNPFGLGNTVTAGIVSAKYRQIGSGPNDDFIQTDASINPGSSGGPLLNIDKEVIGINSRIFSQSGGNVGIGFAIPINMAKQLLPQLREGNVKRSWIGAGVQSITPSLKMKLGLGSDDGALISYVVSGGPAEKAGITRGDVILKFDGKPVRSSRDLHVAMASTPIDKKVTVGIMRGTLKVYLKIRTEEHAEDSDIEPLPEALSQLGIEVQEITAEMVKKYGLSRSRGVIVADFVNGSQAKESGLIPGDIIVEFDKLPIDNMATFKNLLAEVHPGDTILFLIDRDGATLYATLEVKK